MCRLVARVLNATQSALEQGEQGGSLVRVEGLENLVLDGVDMVASPP